MAPLRIDPRASVRAGTLRFGARGSGQVMLRLYRKASGHPQAGRCPASSTGPSPARACSPWDGH